MDQGGHTWPFLDSRYFGQFRLIRIRIVLWGWGRADVGRDVVEDRPELFEDTISLGKQSAIW